MNTYELRFTLILCVFRYFSSAFSEVNYNYYASTGLNYNRNIPGFPEKSCQSASDSSVDFRRIWDNTGLDRRLSTLALITNEAHLQKLSPLELTVLKNVLLEVENLGYAVRSSPMNGSSALRMTDGMFLDDIYELYILTHHNDGSEKSRRCAYTENAIGTALSYQLLFRNLRYPTLEEALTYSNGTGLILFQILVGRGEEDENSDFEYYNAALRRVQQLNATYTINSEKALRWLLKPLAKCPYYYGYPGAALDIRTGALSPTALLLQIPLECSPTISLRQFLTHTLILNQNSQPTANVLPSYPSYRRYIIRSNDGIKVIESPAT